MYFCPKCNFMLDICNNISNNLLQDINTVEDFLDLFDEVNNIDYNYKIKFKLNDLEKNNKFLKLDNKIKKNILSNFEKITQTKNIYFFCNNCNYIEPVKNGEILFTSSSNNYNYNNDHDSQSIILDPTLPRTKDFICPNTKCLSNSKKSQREAIFYRADPKSYKLTYICTTCLQKWYPK